MTTNPIGLNTARNRSLPQVVYKYRVMVGETMQIYWPPGTRVTLSRVASDDSGAVEFWMAHTKPTGERDLDELWEVDVEIYATGQPIPGRFDVVSTCIDNRLGLVWHLVISRGE